MFTSSCSLRYLRQIAQRLIVFAVTRTTLVVSRLHCIYDCTTITMYSFLCRLTMLRGIVVNEQALFSPESIHQISRGFDTKLQRDVLDSVSKKIIFTYESSPVGRERLINRSSEFSSRTWIAWEY